VAGVAASWAVHTYSHRLDSTTSVLPATVSGALEIWPWVSHGLNPLAKLPAVRSFGGDSASASNANGSSSLPGAPSTNEIIVSDHVQHKMLQVQFVLCAGEHARTNPAARLNYLNCRGSGIVFFLELGCARNGGRQEEECRPARSNASRVTRMPTAIARPRSAPNNRGGYDSPRRFLLQAFRRSQ